MFPMDYLAGVTSYVINAIAPKENKFAPVVTESPLSSGIFEPNMLIVRLAGLSGALAVTLGAYGAHG